MTALKKTIGIAVVAVVTVLLIVSGTCAAESYKGEVTADVTGLTITVDDTIAGWGYYVKVDSGTPVKHTEEVCRVSVSKGLRSAGGSLVQVLINGEDGLPEGWKVKVAVSPVGEVAASDNLVKVTDITAETTLTLAAYESGYTVTMDDFMYDHAEGVSPKISPAPATTDVTFYFSYTSEGEAVLWSQDAGKALNVGTYYIFATVDGKETKRSAFHVTKAPGTVPVLTSENIEVSNMPVVVTLDAEDIGRNLMYSIDDGATWSTLLKAESQAGLFSIPGLDNDTRYTLLLKACETTNYQESSARSLVFKTPDLTPVYKVSYNANGGMNTPDDITVREGEKLDIDTGLTVYRTGYDFAGWYTGKIGGTKVSGTVQVIENMSLYAHWTPVEFTVKFDANGGTGTMSPVSAYVNQAVTLPANTFEYGGKKFAGWAVSSGACVLYADQATAELVPVAYDAIGNQYITLYAVWVDNVYSISGTVTGTDGTKVTLALMYGNTVVEESGVLVITGGSATYTFTRQVPNGVYNIVATTDDGRIVTQIIRIDGSGYSFAIDLPVSGANSVVKVEEKTPQVVVGDLETEAEKNREENKTVTITLTAQAHEEKENFESGTSEDIRIQSDIQDLKKAAETKKSTNQQYLSLDVTKEVKSEGEVESTETLTTTDTVLEINVPFDSSDKDDVKVFRKHGDNVEQLAKIEYIPASPVDGTYYVDTPNGMVRIYSKNFCVYGISWKDADVTQYTIEFNRNGGSGSMDSQTVLEEGWIVLPLNGFTAPTDKEFDCWRVGETRMYPGDTLTPGDDVVVYAVWKPLGNWKVAFDANGGSGSMDAEYVKKGKSMVMPGSTFGAPSGKTFGSWRIGSTLYSPGDVYTPTADVTVYAVWKSTGGGGGSGTTATTYCLVEFEPFDESIVIEDQWLKEGSLVVRPADPVEEGFVFGGWYTEEGKEWNFATDKVYYSMTLYAKWVPSEDRPPLNPVEPVTPVETPLGVIGVLVGLGAGAVLMRRK